MFTCEFCNRNFTAQRSLRRHTIGAKFCLRKRQKMIECDQCNRDFVKQSTYEKHLETHVAKKRNEDLIAEVAELKKVISELNAGKKCKCNGDDEDI